VPSPNKYTCCNHSNSSSILSNNFQNLVAEDNFQNLPLQYALLWLYSPTNLERKPFVSFFLLISFTFSQDFFTLFVFYFTNAIDAIQKLRQCPISHL